MTQTLFIDCECLSTKSIKKADAKVFNDPDYSVVICICYAIDNLAIKSWIPHLEPFIPKDLKVALENYRVVAHNAIFEYAIIMQMLKAYSIDTSTLILRLYRTLAQASYNRLPGSLDTLGSLLLGCRKDLLGSNLIRKLCKEALALEGHEDVILELTKLYSPYVVELTNYCLNDVDLMRKLYHKMIPLPEKEVFLSCYTIAQNYKSVVVDIDFIKRIRFLVDNTYPLLSLELRKLLPEDSPIQNITQIEKLRTHLAEVYKIIIPTGLKKEDWEELYHKATDSNGKKILALMIEAKISILKKYALKNFREKDKTICSSLKYYGAAATGRWSGKGFQLQNLPSSNEIFNLQKDIPKLKEDILALLEKPPEEIIKTNYKTLLSAYIRPILQAREGYTFVIMDFASIEARLCAYFCGDTELLKVFERKDDVYKFMASSLFDKEYNDITKEERFLGKQAVLACQYGIGKDAFFNRVKQVDHEADKVSVEFVHRKFRSINPAIVNAWNSFTKALNQLYFSPSRRIELDLTQKCYLYVKDGTLCLDLPFGRTLFFHKIKKGLDGHSYAVYTSTGTAQKNKLYGAKLFQHVIQASARELLVEYLISCYKANFYCAFHVHDELVLEVKEKRVEQCLFFIKNIHSTLFKSLPTDITTVVSKKYLKF